LQPIDLIALARHPKNVKEQIDQNETDAQQPVVPMRFQQIDKQGPRHGVCFPFFLSRN
jgi:hypothetical protein